MKKKWGSAPLIYFPQPQVPPFTAPQVFKPQLLPAVHEFPQLVQVSVSVLVLLSIVDALTKATPHNSNQTNNNRRNYPHVHIRFSLFN